MFRKEFADILTCKSYPSYHYFNSYYQPWSNADKDNNNKKKYILRRKRLFCMLAYFLPKIDN